EQLSPAIEAGEDARRRRLLVTIHRAGGDDPDYFPPPTERRSTGVAWADGSAREEAARRQRTNLRFAPRYTMDAGRRQDAATEADRPEVLASRRRSLEPWRCGRHADELARQDQQRDVAVAIGVSAIGRDDGAHLDLAPGQVVAPELDGQLAWLHVAREHPPLPIARGYAVVRGHDQILGYERPGARHVANDA